MIEENLQEWEEYDSRLLDDSPALESPLTERRLANEFPQTPVTEGGVPRSPFLLSNAPKTAAETEGSVFETELSTSSGSRFQINTLEAELPPYGCRFGQTTPSEALEVNVPELEGLIELPEVGEISRAVTAARYATWSDANDRARGRNPRNQLIAGRQRTEKNVHDYPPAAGRNERLFVLHNFKIDGAALRSDHRAYLADVSKWMAQGGNWRVSIEAHASRTGARRHDDVLSEDRYLATRAYLETELLRRGVDISRVRIAGEGVGFRHTHLPGEDPRARSVYAVVQPDPSSHPPQAWPPPSMAINWLIVIPPSLLFTARVENPPPIRADEGGKFLNSFRCGDFLVFVPQRVTLGSRKDIKNVKVHVFFAAGGVLDRIVNGIPIHDTNDVVLHGLRGASDQSEWITIGVEGILNGANTVSDAQISSCLQSLGINSPPEAIRLTGHSRGCDSLMATVSRKLIKTRIERIVFLDEAVEHVPLDSKNPDGTPDPKRGSVRLNRVLDLFRGRIDPRTILSYEPTDKSKNLLTGQSAKVPGAKYFDLDADCMAAIGAARLVEDAMVLNPVIAIRATANPKIIAQLQNLHPNQAALPPRGSLTTGPSTATQTNINAFCSDPTIGSGVEEIRRDPVLLRFINQNNLGRYSTVPDWTPFAAHEFFVAEIAHELTE
jgi:outer membrane protein OmpA-like peptidoglycan-associated protein